MPTAYVKIAQRRTGRRPRQNVNLREHTYENHKRSTKDGEKTPSKPPAPVPGGLQAVSRSTKDGEKTPSKQTSAAPVRRPSRGDAQRRTGRRPRQNAIGDLLSGAADEIGRAHV